MRSFLALLFVLLSAAPHARAGGSAERTLLVVDPASPEALWVANHYARERDLPERNLLYLDPDPGTWAAFSQTTLPAFLGSLEQRELEGRIDVVLVAPGTSFFLQAPAGAVQDGCAPVNRFALGSAFVLARLGGTIAGGTSVMLANGYARSALDARAFDASHGWSGGNPSASGTRYFLGALLGYTGLRGNTVEELLDMIDRSVAADGAFPAGTAYLMQTSDQARSAPRHGAYPTVAAAIDALGGAGEHLFGNLPLGRHDCIGIMTGLAAPDIDGADLTLLPGAFADHLTSFAATFDSSSQTKCSRWIAKGASGSCGAVEEPCNYAGKFPHARFHWFYRAGLSLGEAWLRSLAYVPFQNLLVGDPLTRPFAPLPEVSLVGLPRSAVAGLLVLAPSASSPAGHALARFELFVDGERLATRAPGESFVLDTRALPDGPHELRVLAVDATPVASVGRLVTSFESANHGRSATLALQGVATGDYRTRFSLAVDASGAAVRELRLVGRGRVLAASASAPATLGLHGRVLGAGLSRLWLEADFEDGTRARSAALELEVLPVEGSARGATPVAFGYARRLAPTATCVLELPASFEDPLGAASYVLTTAPSQASILAQGPGWIALEPAPGASGTDLLAFRVDAPSGSSPAATIAIDWSPPPACPAPASECVGAPNSVGPGAALSHDGAPSIAADELVLFVSGCPPATIGIFFVGDGATQTAFGNGFLCVAPPVTRLGSRVTDALGTAARELSVLEPALASGAHAVQAGRTLRYQFWYRNPAGGGAGFNTSDALAVTWCP